MLNQKYIYSEKDFWDKWELLMGDVAKFKGDSFKRTSYNNTLVTAILAYHGLTRAQIVALKNQDITSDGITGYDVTFDKKSLKTLIDCKGYTQYDEPYIWTGRKIYSRAVQVTENTLTDFFKKNQLGDSEYLPLFSIAALSDAYKFLRIKQFCEAHNLVITGFTRSELTPLYPYYKQMCEIAGVTYNKDNSTPLLRFLRRYMSDFFALYPAEVKQEETDDQNKQLFKKSLLEKIAIMESTLAEIKAMVDFID